MTKSKLFSIDVHAFQWLRQLRQLRSALANLAAPLLPAALSLLQHPLHLPLPPLHRPRDQGGAFPMDRPLPRPALHLAHLQRPLPLLLPHVALPSSEQPEHAPGLPLLDQVARVPPRPQLEVEVVALLAPLRLRLPAPLLRVPQLPCRHLWPLCVRVQQRAGRQQLHGALPTQQPAHLPLLLVVQVPPLFSHLSHILISAPQVDARLCHSSPLWFLLTTPGGHKNFAINFCYQDDASGCNKLECKLLFHVSSGV